jgi:hypothetical protein
VGINFWGIYPCWVGIKFWTYQLALVLSFFLNILIQPTTAHAWFSKTLMPIWPFGTKVHGWFLAGMRHVYSLYPCCLVLDFKKNLQSQF